MTRPARFRVGLTADFYDDHGQLKYDDIGLDLFDRCAQVETGNLDRHQPEVGAAQIQPFQGLIVLTPRITAQTLKHTQDFLAIGRFGVGYDTVDVAACTEAHVVLFITEGAVDHSVAEATVGWMLALTHHLTIKDRLVRTGNWHERSRWMGTELRDRTLGIIGFGGIGRAVARMLSGFHMRPPLVFDPFVSADKLAAAGCRPATLENLLTESDFVSLHCPLNANTRNLLSARELALMKPTAYLINTARGGIVNEADLYVALSERRIAGAALDCFEGEPLLTPPTFSDLDNVLLAPHSIAWTQELFRDIGRAACQGMIDLAHGKRPRGVINPEVFDHPLFQEKWKRWTVT